MPHFHYLGNYFDLTISGGPRDGESIFRHDGFNADNNGRVFDTPIDIRNTRIALSPNCDAAEFGDPMVPSNVMSAGRRLQYSAEDDGALGLAHNGALPRYLAWCLIGVVILVFILGR